MFWRMRAYAANSEGVRGWWEASEHMIAGKASGVPSLGEGSGVDGGRDSERHNGVEGEVLLAEEV